VVELVLRRLAKRRLLKRGHNRYRISGPIPIGALEERRAAARRQQAVVLNRLREFAKQTHDVTWSEAEATEAFLGYLSHFAVECLRTFTRGIALPDLTPSPADKRFVVGSFITHVYASEPAVFECVVVFVKGQHARECACMFRPAIS
jgi:hypothetical protein